MALDILASDLVVDETSGLTDDDINPSIAPYLANTTVQHLLGLDALGGLSSPAFAIKSDFVVASAGTGETVSSVTLTQDSSGTPFSKTDGVNSGIQTVDGNYVWLFQSSNVNFPNVVIGVIGTSDPNAEPAESGPLAFAFALVGTSATNYDLYTVEFVPLLHPDATNPDDQVDLADAVFASVAGTKTVSFTGANAPPGINDFYCLNSPTDATKQILVTGFIGAANASPNVSTQGFGVANQSINPTETLQVDFVTGGNLSGGSASQIQYGSHIETITSAGFTINQITPSNPNLRVDLTISAFNVTGNEQGLNFYDGSPTTDALITSITLTGQSGVGSAITVDGTYNVAGNIDVVVSGLGTNDVTITGLDNVTTVDITTSSPMDRITVRGVDANEGCDITEFHYSAATPNAYTEEVGSFINFDDDFPIVTAAFDADPVAGGIQTPEQLLNTLNATASGTFGYDLAADQHTAAYYAGGGSDFVDANNSLAGVQITLTGTVDNAQNPAITQAVATMTAETASSATFAFSFHYDKDPNTAGVQDGTAGGTLVFDKVNDTYTFTLTDIIDGFSFDVLHTNELIAKAPAGNTGHPLIVASQLTPNGDPDPFFVQFTANSTTNSIGFGFNSSGDGATVGDTAFNNGGATHDMVTNLNEDWVSATQATNGVAGDTIQKGECLTLRFFEENILGDVNPGAPDGGTERLDPTATTSGVIIKFDGIGNSEDLVLILDLIDGNGNEITRAVNVQNSDLIKGNANIPAPYNAEFTLDNNDALLIIEANDYNAAGETYQIQGVQIMQSANGLTGQAINLNGAVGTNGGSSATSSLTAWDLLDNDVLKIVDIGFIAQSSDTIGASLNFAFDIADADGDLMGVQNIPVQIADSFI